MKNYKLFLAQIKTFIFDIDGVLTDGKILINSDGELLRSFDTKDGYAIKCALVKGFKVAVISGGQNEAVRERFLELGVFDIYLGVHQKLDAYQDLLNIHNLNPNEILYIGDDIPDIPVMKKVGLGCCPADAVSDVKAMADYISHKKGGKGCVRELIEQVLRVQGKWTLNIGAGNIGTNKN